MLNARSYYVILIEFRFINSTGTFSVLVYVYNTSKNDLHLHKSADHDSKSLRSRLIYGDQYNNSFITKYSHAIMYSIKSSGC